MEEKQDALRDVLFRPGFTVPPQDPPNLTDNLPGDIPHEKLTRTEVKEAIYEQSPSKAPGDSQITFRAIRWAWEVEAELIFSIMHHCVETGHHPRLWRQAIAVALRKPKKPDYSEPRAYRLIQLLECMGKVLEKVVARRLGYM
ncbi:hypothetical protein C8J55DRAFT_433411, partial [Lentinula edodes]